MRVLLKKLRSQSGATLTDYALVLSLLALPSLTLMGTLHDAMTSQFTALETAVEAESSSSATTTPPGPTPPEGTTTTSPPATTTSTTTTSTTSTTTLPPPTTTSTTTTTTTTTTAAPPPPATTTPPGAPDEQVADVDTDGGWLEFELVDGEISLSDHDLKQNWRGDVTENPDGSLTVHLWKRRGSGEVYVTAWVDTDGYLHITVS